jgi:hypothetical protein
MHAIGRGGRQKKIVSGLTTHGRNITFLLILCKFQAVNLCAGIKDALLMVIVLCDTQLEEEGATGRP